MEEEKYLWHNNNNEFELTLDFPQDSYRDIILNLDVFSYVNKKISINHSKHKSQKNLLPFITATYEQKKETRYMLI